MNLKDDGGETISKTILDWLTWVGAIATLLAGIFGLFLPEENAQRLSFGAAILLATASGAIFLYQRRRAAKLKIAESLEPLSATAALRGLLPFEEGDQLPGRARDVQELYTLVASSSFRFGVLWGESGCGKTSLLRAGLVPKLRNEKFLPLYINKPTNNPQEAIRSDLLKEVSSLEKQTNKSLNQLLKSATPKGKKIAVLFDQFEEFFLTNRTPKSRAGFIKWLGETIADESVPVVFLIGIRADFFAQLQNFAPQIPEPTSTRSTYQLQNFDTEQAKQIFSAAAKADGIPFEPELIQAVIRDLETEDFIRPAELQVVGTRLKRKYITRLNQYEALGSARGILSSYISDEIKQSQNAQTARLVLRLMCADVVETKSQTDLSLDDILHGVSGTEQSGDVKTFSHPEEIQAILNQFVTARVLIHTDDNKYNLVHDYLAPYVRTATEGTETKVERANRMLKRYVAEYKEDPNARIPFGRVRLIQKFASPEVAAKDKAQELIKKSKRAFYWIVASLVTPLILILAIYFFYLSSSYYLGIENAYIVIYSGLPHLPGSGHLVIQTDLKQADLVNTKIRDDINLGKVTGFWFQKVDMAKGGYQLWADQSLEGIQVLTRAQMLRWLGRPNDARNISINTITDPRADSRARFGAAEALGLLAQANPEAVTSDVLAKLIEIVADPQAGLGLRSSAATALRSLAQANPEAVTSDLLPKLINIVTVPRDDPEVHYPAVDALGSLALANPEAVTSDLLARLIDFVSDPGAHPDSRSRAVGALGSLAQANPEAITAEMIQRLFAQLRADTDSRGRIDAAYALFSIAFNNPKQEKTILRELMELSTSPRPHWRMAANRTLEMIAIGDLLQEGRTHPDQIGSIKLRLNYLSSYIANEEGLRFAATVVLPEVEKIEAEAGK